MALTVCLLTLARQQTISRLSSPAAQADWQRWQQQESQRQSDPSAPVRRRTPKSTEPPALVLLRDSFPAVAVAVMVVVTICFAFGVLSLKGLASR
jgi:hypothetical protein